MKKQNTVYNYRTNSRNVQLKFDENFAEKVIPENDLVRLLDEIAEDVESPLERALKRKGWKHGTNPYTLLKIILYAAAENISSSREIVERCNRDINYIWLLNGEDAPSYRAICRFRSGVLSECSEEIFYALDHKLQGRGEINFEHLFVDGTKIEANAGKYSFIWKKSTNKFEIRVKAKLEKRICELSATYGIIETDEFEFYNQLRAMHPEPFVHGRGKRKSKSNFVSTVTYYECESCEGCPHKKNCTRAKGNRKMQVSKKFVEQRKASLERITSPMGVLLRMNRSIQAEGAFGVVKYDYGFDRFVHRGKKKIFNEILIVAIGYNVRKYHNKLQQNRTGSQLHEKVVA